MKDDYHNSNISNQQQQSTETNTWRVSIAYFMWDDRPHSAANEEDWEDQYNESDEHNR